MKTLKDKKWTRQITVSAEEQALALIVALLNELIWDDPRERVLRSAAAYFGYRIEKL